jgi:phage/plasmid-like protein (TIGR03299 family)
MSQETSEWLNTNTLIGFTEKRGNAWHYRASDQGDEPNHYPGAIPEEDVQRRLFDWHVLEGTYSSDFRDDEGNKRRISDPTRKMLIRSDTGKIIKGFKKSYRVHEYDEWLLNNLHVLLDDSELGIGSAGLLKDGAQAWVQVELPDTITTPQGVQFRPFMSAATSLDGSMSSIYFTGSQLVMCDNTLTAGITGATDIVKYRHSAGSLGRISEAREALRLVYEESEDFQAELEMLCNLEVSDKQWDAFLDLHVPMPEKPGRGQTMAENHRDALNLLYRKDARCADYAGTAFGVVQTVNTYNHHVVGVRNVDRAERNASKVVFGEFAAADRQALSQLKVVLAA